MNERPRRDDGTLMPLPGDRVEHRLIPTLDHRTVIAVGVDWLWLDFQQAELDAGELPARLPMENYAVVGVC